MKDTRTIESFLNKGMTELERNEFINEMKSNPGLANDVKLYEEINEAIADDLVFEFRKSVREIINSSREKQPLRIDFTRKLVKYPLIASICILIGFSLWQIVSVFPPEKAFSKYYKPYFTDVSTRSAIASTDKSLVAIRLYQDGDYEASFEILANYMAKNYGDQTARFYYGMNSLELGKTDIALAELKQVEQDLTSEYALHARWYLSMALLKMNQKEEAIKYLKSIAQEENFYSERATIIIKKLNS